MAPDRWGEPALLRALRHVDVVSAERLISLWESAYFDGFRG